MSNAVINTQAAYAQKAVIEEYLEGLTEGVRNAIAKGGKVKIWLRGVDENGYEKQIAYIVMGPDFDDKTLEVSIEYKYEL